MARVTVFNVFRRRVGDDPRAIAKTPWWEQHLRFFFIAPSLILLALLAVFPAIMSWRFAFSRVTFKLGELGIEPIGFSNFTKAFSDNLIIGSTVRTATWTVVVVSAEIIVGLFIAFLMSRLHSRARTMFTAALIIPLVLPPVSVGAGWVVMMDVQFGVLNYLLSLVGIEPLLWLADSRTALPAIMLIDIWQSSMFVFILMYAGILSLPQDPYEAAAIDGASPWQIFRDVTIPLLRPTFVVILLLRTLDAARIADRMLVMTRGGPGSSTETVVLSIYKYAFIHFNFGYASALSVMFQVFLIILATFYIRRILRT